MKATLVKERGYYDLYRIDEDGKKVTFASTEDYKQKLSKQNCDEIFGVVDVEKLAEEYCTYEPKNVKELRDVNLAKLGFRDGFNKAMELNKDKVFTVEDMQECWRASAYYSTNQSRINYESFIQSLQQPTEIEVMIEMECKIGCEHLVFNGKNSLCCGNKVPKLDSNGCLILKRVV